MYRGLGFVKFSWQDKSLWEKKIEVENGYNNLKQVIKNFDK